MCVLTVVKHSRCLGINHSMNIQKLFKPYIVRRNHGQCQVLIPLIELDDLCDKIETVINGETILYQIHVKVDDGSTTLVAQREIIDKFDLEDFVGEIQDKYKNSKLFLCNEKSKHFIMQADNQQ